MVKEEKKCQVCNRVLYDEEFCIFHSPKRDKDVRLFQEKLDEIFKNKSLETYYFRFFKFPKGIHFPEVIEKKVTFSETDFYGVAFFEKCTFKNSVRFWYASFEDEVDFSSANFLEEAYFTGVVFKGHASFKMASFKKASYFFEVTFQNEVEFSFATFEDILIINGETNHRIFCKNMVDFSNVRFLNPMKVSFQRVDLSKFSFIGTDLRKIEFADVDWNREKGRDGIYDEINVDALSGFYDEDQLDYSLISQVYKRLRANYEENLNYAEAGDFHIGEMEMRRKGEKKIYNKAVIWAYKLISNYGESYWRPLGWIAMFLLVFPLLYALVGIVPPTQINGSQNFEKLRDFWSSLTYSLSVFSLVRERPYHTINNLGHILTILESIFSPVMIAFFLLALRRRFKR